MEVKFLIDEKGNLTNEEVQRLNKAYKTLFMEMYGRENYEMFIQMSLDEEINNLIGNPRVKKNAIKEKVMRLIYGQDGYEKRMLEEERARDKANNHYFNTFNPLESVKSNDYIELLVIYDENNEAIGFGRILIFDDNCISVPDIAFVDLSRNIEANLWQKALSYIENYYAKLGFKKMYVEVPHNRVDYLQRAYNGLKFYESPENILVTEQTYAYLLDKSIERTRENEPGDSRK